jgi:hypothetical protein
MKVYPLSLSMCSAGRLTLLFPVDCGGKVAVRIDPEIRHNIHVP